MVDASIEQAKQQQWSSMEAFTSSAVQSVGKHAAQATAGLAAKVAAIERAIAFEAHEDGEAVNAGSSAVSIGATLAHLSGEVASLKLAYAHHLQASEERYGDVASLKLALHASEGRCAAAEAEAAARLAECKAMLLSVEAVRSTADAANESALAMLKQLHESVFPVFFCQCSSSCTSPSFQLPFQIYLVN